MGVGGEEKEEERKTFNENELRFMCSVVDLPSKKQQLQALNLLVILLPDANRDTLKVSWPHLHEAFLKAEHGISWFVAKQCDVQVGSGAKIYKERATFKGP